MAKKKLKRYKEGTGAAQTEAPRPETPQLQGIAMNGKIPVMRDGTPGADTRAAMLKDFNKNQAQQRYLNKGDSEQYFDGLAKYPDGTGGVTTGKVGGAMQGVGGLMTAYGALADDPEVAKYGAAVAGVGSATSTIGNEFSNAGGKETPINANNPRNQDVTGEPNQSDGGYPTLNNRTMLAKYGLHMKTKGTKHTKKMKAK